MRDLFFRIRAVDQTAAAFARVRSGLKGIDGAFAGLNDRAARASSRLRSIGESLSAHTTRIRDAFSGSMAAYDASARSAAKVEAAIRSTGSAGSRPSRPNSWPGSRRTAAGGSSGRAR